MAERELIVGLVAHVDAGKTTLSEALLFESGQLRRAGRVDHRDTFLDTDAMERERGITIFSKQARLTWQGISLTLVDTPGHTDFSSETERTLGVLDAAVLVISGADGVQSHTLTLWRLLKAYRVPVVLFVNKMDQEGTNRDILLHGLKSRLSDACVDWKASGAAEEIAMCDEEAMENFLNTGAIPVDRMSRLVGERKVYPVLFGSALKNRGVKELLDTLKDFVPARPRGDAFGARVYKISHDPQGARLTWLKVTGGTLKVRDTVTGDGWEDKVSQIRLYSGSKFQNVQEAVAGSLCAVTGLEHTRAGDGLGAEKAGEEPMLTPVFTTRVLPPMGVDPHQTLACLRTLEEEDPELHVIWNQEKREIHVRLMGEVQMEILDRMMKERFHMPVGFSEGSILYRETIAEPVEGVGHYEPLRHYAEVHLLMEPGERGSGMQFASACSEDELERNWQRLILTHLMEKQHLGVLTGSPITDMKITLIAGRAHLKHTEGGDFRQATYRAVRQGLMSAKSVLLEPWYRVRLEVPSDCVGRAMNDLSAMGGTVDPPEAGGEITVLTGTAPAAAMKGYSQEMISYTRGRGKLFTSLKGYDICGDQEAVARAMGYDPARDVENPADSVFCSHGAGVTVPWDEAPARMHIRTGVLGGGEDRQAHAGTAGASAGEYRGTAEEDEELKRIFERTYGPVRQRTVTAAHRPTVNSLPMEIQIPTREVLIVDGYNVIFAWPELKKMAGENLEHARQSLIDILSNYRGFHACETHLVFDAYRVHGGHGGEENVDGIHVIYTREGELADNYIEKMSREYGRSRDTRVRVVTSDGLEQTMILGAGALRVPASEFYREVENTKVRIGEILDRNRLARPKAPEMERALREALEKQENRMERRTK